jgi:glycerophosphoryl diester phosphodiesterase
VNYIAPALFVLVTLENGKIVPSAYAKAAKDAGLKIITWSLERSGPLNAGGGGYYKTITPAVTGSGVMYELVDVLAQQVGVVGIFSDWPGTVTYYANCMGL